MAKILIVDDALVMRMNLKKILTDAGHTVVGEAKSGSEGIWLYKETQPDVVTMDITMPGMDGIEALKKILDFDPKARVVMVSALSQRRTVLTALEAGAKNYILKPIDSQNVPPAIDKAMKL